MRIKALVEENEKAIKGGILIGKVTSQVFYWRVIASWRLHLIYG